MAFPFYFVFYMCVLSPITSTCNTMMFLDLSLHIFIISLTLFASSPAKLCVILIIHNNFCVLFASFSLPFFFSPFKFDFEKMAIFFCYLLACLLIFLFCCSLPVISSAHLFSEIANLGLLFLTNCILGACAWGIFCRRCAGTLVIASVH